MLEKSCAFTGHRPAHFHFKYNEEHPDCVALKNAIEREICALVEKGVTTFYSGMALGVDMWAAESVLALKKQNPSLKLIAVIPCDTQAIKWTAPQQNRYFTILAYCDDKICTSRQYTSDCMFKRNRYLVDHAQNIIAVYDGQGQGGTANTVRYATSEKRNVVIIPVR